MNLRTAVLLLSLGLAQAQNLTTVAGTGIGGNTGDNIAPTTARINYPFHAITEAKGNVLIAKCENHRI